MEHFNLVKLFAHAHKFNGLAGDRLNGQSSAPSGITVQLCQHNTINVQSIIKSLSGIDRILANHGIYHQKNLGGLHRSLDLFQFLHQGFIHMEAAGGVQKHHVIAVLLGVFHRSFGNIHRIRLSHLENRKSQLLAYHL